MLTLDAKLEAVLFWKGEPMKRRALTKVLGCSEHELADAILKLDQKLESRGVSLQEKEDEVTLGTAKELSPLFETLTREELSRDLGKAGLETLSIILYKGPISRREIDYIRGVNSAFIVRNLLVRGLVEKVSSKKDERVFLYKTTFDLLSMLGLQKESDLPEFETVREEIKALEAAVDAHESGEKIETQNHV